MNARTFQERLRRRELMTCIFINSAAPDFVELVGYAGFDFVAIDMEHGSLSGPGSSVE